MMVTRSSSSRSLLSSSPSSTSSSSSYESSDYSVRLSNNSEKITTRVASIRIILLISTTCCFGIILGHVVHSNNGSSYSSNNSNTIISWEFLKSYMIELLLSIENNLFVFILLFDYFGLQRNINAQERVLRYGVLLAMASRGIYIYFRLYNNKFLFGKNIFHHLIIPLAVILICSSINMFNDYVSHSNSNDDDDNDDDDDDDDNDMNEDVSNHTIVRISKDLIGSTDQYYGNQFFVGRTTTTRTSPHHGNIISSSSEEETTPLFVPVASAAAVEEAEEEEEKNKLLQPPQREPDLLESKRMKKKLLSSSKKYKSRRSRMTTNNTCNYNHSHNVSRKHNNSVTTASSSSSETESESDSAGGTSDYSASSTLSNNSSTNGEGSSSSNCSNNSSSHHCRTAAITGNDSSNGKLRPTPLLICLITIELVDFVFAINSSIPTVLLSYNNNKSSGYGSASLMMTKNDLFIVYTSNIFAVVMLRSLYVVIRNLMLDLPLVKFAIAFLLFFVGIKVIIVEFIYPNISTMNRSSNNNNNNMHVHIISFIVIVCTLSLSIIISFIRKKLGQRQQQRRQRKTVVIQECHHEYGSGSNSRSNKKKHLSILSRNMFILLTCSILVFVIDCRLNNRSLTAYSLYASSVVTDSFRIRSGSNVNVDDPSSATSIGGGSGSSNVKPKIYRFDTMDRDYTIKHQLQIPYHWHKIWESSGWVPEVLNVEKHIGQRRNGRYPDLWTGLIDQTPNLNNDQRRHIAKYIVMSEVGGGWVAHSDVFPLHSFARSDGLSLPNNGQLTIYNEQIPCLMSGSEREWVRMAQLLISHAQSYDPLQHQQQLLLQQAKRPQRDSINYDLNEEEQRLMWTESMALRDISLLSVAVPSQQQQQDNNNNNNFIIHDEVYSDSLKHTRIWINGISNGCEQTQTKRAVHLNFDEFIPQKMYKLKKRIIVDNPKPGEDEEDDQPAEDPSEFVTNWLRQWLVTCQHSDYFDKF